MAQRWIKGEPITAVKLNDTVDHLNSVITSTSGVTDGNPRFDKQCFIEIQNSTLETNADTTLKRYIYKCKVLRFTGHLGYTDSSDKGLETDTSFTSVDNFVTAYNVFEDNDFAQFPVPNGTRCPARLFYQQGYIQVWFWFHNTTHPFIVRVKKVSGVAGSSSTNCTYAYDCYTLRDDRLTTDEIVLKTAASPTIPRFSNTTYTYAPDYSLALACWNESGVFKLLQIYEEVPQSQAC
jgi:hypothetical protein